MQIATIILAGGKGTRMGSVDQHKVCFEIDGRPAINRAIDTYKACGIQHHVVVVGALAGQVIETVGREHEGVIFAYQAEQRGTGHAARQGARILADLRFDGAVLVVAGDRLIDPQVVERLIAEFRASASDMIFLVGPRGQAQQGRVLRGPDGQIAGVIEHIDLVSRQVLAELRRLASRSAPDLDSQARQLVRQAFSSPKKAAQALGDVWTRLADERPLEPAELLALIPEERTLIRLGAGTSQGQHGNGRENPLVLTLEQADLSQEVNFSIYLVKAEALHYALARLSDDNAQGEEYLPDIINILAQARENGRRRYRILAQQISDPNLVMGFNNPAELLEVQNAFRARRVQQQVVEAGVSPSYRPVQQWQAMFDELLAHWRQGRLSPAGSELAGQIGYIYGSNVELIEERLLAYRELLAACQQRLGPERPVLISRAPGRINMVGRHIDHQGGSCNLMAIDREILVATSLREDDDVNLYNVNAGQFSPRHFSMQDLLAELTWDDWLSLVNSDTVRQIVVDSAGDWAQYVRAVYLRLQKHATAIKLRGMDMIFHGTIPVAAGLSSSSAMVVSTAEAIVAAYGLDVRPRQFVDLCGEGEWFVGTRGGSADHAAMKFAQREAVINVQFLPFVVGQATPFPPGYRLVFCNSHIKAQKAAASREIFNQRVACYFAGLHLIKQFYPRFAPLISHLRDINVRNLPLLLADIYRMMLKLPERASYQELTDLLPETVMQQLAATYGVSQADYPIRGVLLFGISECERGRACPDYLRRGDMAALGRLMRVSHDGDRVVSYDDRWQAHPYPGLSSNAYLLDLMDDLESGEPERVLAAQLHWQPGAYSCSTPELDKMVDIALRAEGVMGAQLAGAGLGGGMMVLAQEEAIPELRRRMTALYYEPAGLEPAILPCIPIAGSGVLAARGESWP